jgi:alcohol dehydrogenase (NADP+)
MKYAYFSNYDKIPLFGLGTWKSKPGEIETAVTEALKSGVRHFDCAKIYANEKEIGNALQKAFSDGLVERKDLFITSKLWNNAHKKEDVLPAFYQTLDDLQLDYLDLYLMHWPIAIKKEVINAKTAGDFLSLNEVPLLDTWNQLIELKKMGVAKHVGVANFSIPNLKLLMAGSELVPEMNQVEAHPYLNQNELLQFCKNNSILFTAYSPLGSRDKSKPEKLDLFENEILVGLAEKNNCSVAQLMLAWGIQRETIVIPKSSNPLRIKENLQSVDLVLCEEDCKKIDQLDRNHRFIDGTFWIVEGNGYKIEDLWA